jgi:hypothetical protein
MDTTEGDKISSTFKIAGVVGLTCVNWNRCRVDEASPVS